MRRKRSQPPQPKFSLISVKVPDFCDRHLRLLAASLGHTRAGVGNLRNFFTALGSGQYQFVPGVFSSRGLETLAAINVFIADRAAFCVQVKAGNNLISYTVLSAKIYIDFTGKIFLIAYAEEVNSLEIQELLHNFTFLIEDIVEVSGVDLPWSSFVPYISVKFWINSQSENYYIPHNDDVLASSHEILQVRGTVITRNISSSNLLIQELFHYQNNCVLMFPNNIKQRLIDLLINNLFLYNIHLNPLTTDLLQQ